ncbi:glycosyltransferase family 4 protein [Planktomarina temperata]|nr:glycosyltransferase family 4 protein [Planktomarina temperata]
MKIVSIVKGSAELNTMNGVNHCVRNLHNEFSQTTTAELWRLRSGKIKIGNELNGIRDFELKTIFSLNWIKIIKEIHKLDRRNTIFHLHSSFILEYYVLSRILSFYKIPYVVTPHGAYSEQNVRRKWIRKIFFFQLFDRTIVRNSAAVHFLNRAEQEQTSNWTKLHSTIVVPNGVDVPEDQKRKNFRKRKEFVFGFLGRIDCEHKGLDIALEAFRNLAQIYPNQVKFHIYGDGKDICLLKKRYASLISSDQVRFLGPVYQNEKLNALRSMDSFVLTSRWEGFPIALLEALSAGVPVIVSQGVNIGYEISKVRAGLVLSTNNVVTLVNTMIEMFEKSDLELTDMSEAAVLLCKRDYSWEAVTKDLCAIYKSIIDKN